MPSAIYNRRLESRRSPAVRPDMLDTDSDAAADFATNSPEDATICGVYCDYTRGCAWPLMHANSMATEPCSACQTVPPPTEKIARNAKNANGDELLRIRNVATAKINRMLFMCSDQLDDNAMRCPWTHLYLCIYASASASARFKRKSRAGVNKHLPSVLCAVNCLNLLLKLGHWRRKVAASTHPIEISKKIPHMRALNP